jgi:hypothetical protein
MSPKIVVVVVVVVVARAGRCDDNIVDDNDDDNSKRERERGHTYTQTKQTPWPLVRKRTIPTERPPFVGEI